MTIITNILTALICIPIILLSIRVTYDKYDHQYIKIGVKNGPTFYYTHGYGRTRFTRVLVSHDMGINGFRSIIISYK